MCRVNTCVALVAVMLALPVVAHAQEATVRGTVTDTTGAVLPGVTIRAVHEDSGNSFEAVTDPGGRFQLPVRVGPYRLSADLAGFASVTRTLTVLVGQVAEVNLQMGVSAVQESVTVTGEAPLLDVTESRVGGNVDPRQLQELPVNGRNWVDLVLLVPGARAVEVQNAPTPRGSMTERGDFQLNVDGQQVTMQSSSAHSGQPEYSRDAIAEFEFISNRFDATQSRSFGVQVNAVTKSGTNTPSGTFSGYFRNDRFNAADAVVDRVLPYSNQQLSGTFGGPLRKDKVHFFANYEYEREPRTFTFTTPYPAFNRDLQGTRVEKKSGGRLDAQFSPQLRLAIRGNAWRQGLPYDETGGARTTASSAVGTDRYMNQLLATVTQVIGNRAVNEVKVGYANYGWDQHSYIKNGTERLGGPTVQLQGLTAGGNSSSPQTFDEKVYSLRDDATFVFESGGHHSLRLGGEYLSGKYDVFLCRNCFGILDARGGPIPANIESLFPDLLDATTWNLAPLSPVSRAWRQTFGRFDSFTHRHTSGAWAQDDWTIVPRLTLNVGVRYDLELNVFANDVEILPFLPGNRPNDTNNVAPRLGFAFSLTNRTVIRGGYGRFFGTLSNPAFFMHVAANTIIPATPYDGRPDFASNPFNGPAPTFESLVPRVCTPALAPGCIRRDINETVVPPNQRIPYSNQASIGLQRQLGDTLGIQTDYVYSGARFGSKDNRNINLSFNPATGANYPFTDVSKRPYPHFGIVTMRLARNRSDLHSWQTAVTKRFSDGWQASGTYTLSGLWDASTPPVSGLEPVPFTTAPDLGGEYTLAASDQRHRAVFSSIWELPQGFQVSGTYLFSSGVRYDTSYGADLRNVGTGGEERLRPDGTIVPRNNFVGKPIHRVDLRFQRRFPLAGRARIDGMLEVFNVFNHANFGGYNTDEVSSGYGRPESNINLAYAPRMLQLGFRFAF